MESDPEIHSAAEEKDDPVDLGRHAKTIQKRRLVLSLVAIGVAFGGLYFWFALLSNFSGLSQKGGVSLDLSEQSRLPANQELLDCTGNQKDTPPCVERREAILALRTLQELERDLNQKQVTSWAKDNFEKALSVRSQGDTEYADESFGKATVTYNAAVEALRSISEYGERLAQQSTSNGYRALEDEDSDTAIKSFKLTLMIQPSNTRAADGLRRATVLDHVVELLGAGDGYFQMGQLEAAQGAYENAATLDSKNVRARKLLARTKAAIVEITFQNALSAGYTALQERNTVAGVSSFRKALAIRPGSDPARQGLEQAKQIALENSVQDLKSDALNKAEQEDWAGALSTYQAILSRDPDAGFAKTGLAHAAVMVAAEQKLDTYLARPDRLSSPAVFAEASSFLSSASRLRGYGPRLNGKNAKLIKIMTSMSTPVPVKIESDNRTSVKILRYGNLDKFRLREIRLRPGKYTMIGSRNGYKTVRLEFNVEPGKDTISVFIACNETL